MCVGQTYGKGDARRHSGTSKTSAGKWQNCEQILVQISESLNVILVTAGILVIVPFFRMYFTVGVNPASMEIE